MLESEASAGVPWNRFASAKALHINGVWGRAPENFRKLKVLISYIPKFSKIPEIPTKNPKKSKSQKTQSFSKILNFGKGWQH